MKVDPSTHGCRHQAPSSRLAEDTDRERVQRVKLAPPWSEPVRETEQVHLVDGVEHLDDGSLDDFVLQACDAQGSLSPVRLRDVASPRGCCPVRSPMQSRVQVAEVVLQLLRVLLPGDAVDAWRGILL